MAKPSGTTRRSNTGVGHDEAAQTNQRANTRRLGRSPLPAVAINAVNQRIAKASGLLGEAADAIEAMTGSAADRLPGPLASAAATTAGSLRGLADRAEAQDAGELLQNAQRVAARHPLATAGIGAVIGAVVALVFTRVDLGSRLPDPGTALNRGKARQVG